MVTNKHVHGYVLSWWDWFSSELHITTTDQLEEQMIKLLGCRASHFWAHTAETICIWMLQKRWMQMCDLQSFGSAFLLTMWRGPALCLSVHCDWVLHLTNNKGHKETGPWFKVSSGGLVETGIDPVTPGSQGEWLIHYITATPVREKHHSIL